MKTIKNIAIIAVLIASVIIIYTFVSDAIAPKMEAEREAAWIKKMDEPRQKELREREELDKKSGWNTMTEEEQCEYANTPAGSKMGYLPCPDDWYGSTQD